MSKINEIKRWWGAKWGGLLQGTTGVGSIFKIANNAVIGTVGVHTIIENTQASAHIAQKIDLGTSAQGHTGILINMPNSSSLARGITIDPSTTWNWYWINFANWGGSGFRWINFWNIWSGNWNIWIYMDVIINNSNWWFAWYWIYQKYISTRFWWGSAGVVTWYWIFQEYIWNTELRGDSNYWIYQKYILWWWTIAKTSYWIYQENLQCSHANGKAIWWWVGNVFWSNSFNNTKFFSLNGSISTTGWRSSNVSEIIVEKWIWTNSTWWGDTFAILNIQWKSYTSSALANYTVWWSILKLENIATQSNWTLIDSRTPLMILNQSGVSNGWHISFNTYTPKNEADVPNNTMWWTGTDLKIKDNTWVVKTATLT